MIHCVHSSGNAKSTTPLSSSSEVLLERADNLLLLCRRLVCTVTKLAGRVDPFQVDLFQCASARLCKHCLAQRHDSLLDTGRAALEEQVVVVHHTVANKAAHSSAC